MSDLSVLSDKQILDRYRHLSDKVKSLKEKIEPMFAEYEKVRQEWLDIDAEIAKRNNLPQIEE